MFNNVGRKIQVIAVVLCTLGIIGSLVLGISLCIISVISGILAMLLGCISSIILSIVVYGIGVAAENTEIIKANMLKSEPLTNHQAGKTVNTMKIESKDGRRSCPNCFSAVSNKDSVCPYCGKKL